jgi:prepilin-type N-terminal cleavage/methylation domain-containing protein
MTHPRSPRPARALRSISGFTLPELLLASVLGAMLLTSLAVSTFGFTLNLDYLEAKAGVGNGIDPVLRRMTRDIREAWWVEKAGPSHLRIYSPDGGLTEYYLLDGKLFLKRPNGDVGVVYTGIDSLTLDTQQVQRKREAQPVEVDGTWLSGGTAETPIAFEVPAQGSLALGFVAPAAPADIPGLASSTEQLLSVQSSVVKVPVAFIAGSGTKNFTATLYESWAPGRGRPDGNALASVTLPQACVPAATSTAGVWDVPSEDLSLSLSAALEPGVGYTLVMSASGSSKLLFKAGVITPTADGDEVSLKSSSGGSYVAQPLMVPYSINGPYQMTATAQQSVVNRVSLTVYPTGQQPQHRSASILSQSYSLDPWLGVVPGQAAP